MIALSRRGIARLRSRLQPGPKTRPSKAPLDGERGRSGMAISSDRPGFAGDPAPALPVSVDFERPPLDLDERTQRLIDSRRSGSTRRRGWIVRRWLAAADLLGVTLAFALAEAIFHGSQISGRYGSGAEVGLFALSLPAWLVLGKLYGLYDQDEARTDHSTADEVFSVFNMLAVGSFGFYAIAYVLPGLTLVPIGKILTFLVFAIPLVVLARSAARSRCRRTDAYIQNTLIIGAGHIGQRVAWKLLQHREYGVNVVGFVDDNPREREERLGDLTILGDSTEISRIVSDYDVERVVVAFSRDGHAETLELIRDLNRLDVQVDIVPRLFEVIGPHATIHAAEGLPLIGLTPAHLSRSARALKRMVDLTGSIFGLLLFAPLFVVTAIAIKLDSPGPVFFRQWRVGQGDRRFQILKLRTMSADADTRKDEIAHLNKHIGADERMFKVSNDPRVTRVGKLLRRWSLDELPQLINVLIGEMSLVGPRPLIPEEHTYVDGWALRRLDLKPGLTGLWQVLGRDDIPFGEMVEPRLPVRDDLVFGRRHQAADDDLCGHHPLRRLALSANAQEGRARRAALVSGRVGGDDAEVQVAASELGRDEPAHLDVARPDLEGRRRGESREERVALVDTNGCLAVAAVVEDVEVEGGRLAQLGVRRMGGDKRRRDVGRVQGSRGLEGVHRRRRRLRQVVGCSPGD